MPLLPTSARWVVNVLPQITGLVMNNQTLNYNFPGPWYNVMTLSICQIKAFSELIWLVYSVRMGTFCPPKNMQCIDPGENLNTCEESTRSLLSVHLNVCKQRDQSATLNALWQLSRHQHTMQEKLTQNCQKEGRKEGRKKGTGRSNSQ